MLSKLFSKAIEKAFPNLYKLNTLASSIEDITVNSDGSLYIAYKRHVITTAGGGIITTSKDIHVLNSDTTMHINPRGYSISGNSSDIDSLVVEEKKKLPTKKDNN